MDALSARPPVSKSGNGPDTSKADCVLAAAAEIEKSEETIFPQDLGTSDPSAGPLAGPCEIQDICIKIRQLKKLPFFDANFSC
jgi:hypothetical protein